MKIKDGFPESFFDSIISKIKTDNIYVGDFAELFNFTRNQLSIIFYEYKKTVSF